MSILDKQEKIKTWLASKDGNDVLIGAIVILVGLSGFGLGRISAASKSAPGVVIEGTVIPVEQFASAGQAAAITGVEDRRASTSQTSGAIFASKNGTKYYFTHCSSRVKEENKIWFTTEDEALAAGFTKSSTCK